jgi:hypothetical protein
MTASFHRFATAFLIAFGILLLSGCGESVDLSGGLKPYDGGEFTIGVAPDWKVITSTDFYAEIPKETLVAFTSPEPFDGFFMNVNVVREDLRQPVSPIDYGRANLNLSNQTLTEYRKVQEAQIQVGGAPALLHIFTARLNPSEKLIKFAQLYTTRGNYGYIISGGMLPDTPQETRDLIGAMVTSFNFK